ncbi:MAG: hypothetical protein ABWY93_04745 [Mycobacterium sp.]
MGLYYQLYELVMRLPPMYIRVGPGELLTTAGLVLATWIEVSMNRRHR